MLLSAPAHSRHSHLHRAVQRLQHALGRCAPARWAIPASIAFLLVASSLLLVALSSTKERSEAHEQVIMDSLLARESIAFQIKREIEALQQIAAGTGRDGIDSEDLERRLRAFLQRAPEVRRIALVDASLHPLLHGDRNAANDASGQVPREIAEATLDKVRELAKPAFSAAFQSPRGPSLVLIVPVPSASGPADTFLWAVYELHDLLQEMIPWTLAQDYAFTLADVADTMRARRASVGPGREAYTHQLPLELPGTTLRLGLNSVKGAPDWIANVLRGGIAILAATLLWSLWALWRDHRGRVAAEQRAGEEAAFRRTMGHCAVIGLVARDMNGGVTYANPAFCEMVGLDEQALIGRAWAHLCGTPDLHDEHRRRLDDVLQGCSPKSAHETLLLRNGAQRFPAAIYDAPLLKAEGRQVGWMSSVVDLTEQKQVEERERLQQERLQTAARLTTMGELASSLAHELNQPLGAIASYLAGSRNMVERGDVERAELLRVLESASAQTQRAGQVIRRVHQFVRKQEPRYVDVDVHQLMDECRTLIDLQAKRAGVDVATSLPPHLPPVFGDPVMLQQVILNLTRNAIEAMGDVAAERRKLVIAAARDEGGVRISVRDFGSGIAPHDAERIFSPFHTTKVEGMGMGLAICRGIVESHGGRLWFDAMADGTVFNCWVERACG